MCATIVTSADTIMTVHSSLVIRPATCADAASCASVYRSYVLETNITFEIEPPAAESFAQRIDDAQAQHDWFVAERGGNVIGYAYGHPFAERAAYGWSCETSIYVSGAAHRQGVGRALYQELLDRLARLGYRRAFAGITLPNEASVQLHRNFGFEESGCLRRVGWKHGAWHDVAWMQRDLQPSEIDPPAPIRTGVPHSGGAT